MNLTNNHSAPEELFLAVKNDPYSPGDSDFTATGLIAPPRILALREIYKDEIEEDVTDLYARFYGQVAHGILERYASSDAIVEKRFYGEFHGKRISAQIDHYKDGVITDYKCVETAKFNTIGAMKSEHEEQLNIQAELMRQNGYEVKGVRILFIFRDWYKAQAKQNDLYPQTWWAVDNGNLWESIRAIAFIVLKVHIHERAKTELPECTPQERWDRPTQYAVIKKGATRATKLFDKEDSAVGHADNLGDKYQVVLRPGMRVRCEWYCEVAKFCEQFKQYKKEQEK